jgi:hypothetical protein
LDFLALKKGTTNTVVWVIGFTAKSPQINSFKSEI